MFRIGIIVLALYGLAPGVASAGETPSQDRKIERLVDYSRRGSGAGPNSPRATGPGSAAFDQSYDLHPAQGSGGALVLFVHSRFWNERQPDSLVERGFVRGLVRAGHSVAVLRHRLGEKGRHPIAVQDVARAVASLLDRVEAGEFDSDRVFLAGHSSGAQLALLVALDPRWLAREGKDARALAGVLSLSGIVDLAADAVGSDEEERMILAAFADSKARRAASPSEYVNPDLPAILLLNAARDIPGYLGAARRYAKKARAAGQPAIENLVAVGRDHYSILDLATSGGVHHVFEFLESRPREGILPEMWSIASTWRDPELSTEEFHLRYDGLVREYEADRRIVEVANLPFRTKPGAPIRLRFSRYKAIDLVALLKAMGPSRIGSGEWLEVTNARGEKAFFSMSRIRELAPRVVIGVDDERNLFRATDLYHTRRRYTWVDAAASRVDMARPLGAFLYFSGEEPSNTESSTLVGRYSLTIDSFRRRQSDPLEALADLPTLVRETLVSEHTCISCHRFREVGGRAFHIRARDGKSMGGHALPLERYPAVVWKRFVYDQRRVAEEVGANAVDLAPPVARALYDFVVAERNRRRLEPWNRPDRERD